MKVKKFSSLKIVETNIWPRICYLLNLPNGFKNPAKKWDNCKIDNFTANSEKKLLDLAANQLKWQHSTKSFSYSRVGYLWLCRNYIHEASWLRHNKNSKWLQQLVLGPGVAHFKPSSRRQSIFDEQEGKVKRLSPKPVQTIFYQEFVTC